MMEIYNEKVRDLLSTDSKNSSGLPVRQSASEGFFVQGLKNVPVGSYKDIERRMDQGKSFLEWGFFGCFIRISIYLILIKIQERLIVQ